MRLPKATKSGDGVLRSTWHIHHRLSKEDLASILANSAARMGVRDTNGYTVYGEDEIYECDMRPLDIAKAIREELENYGTTSTVFEGSDQLHEWATAQILYIWSKK